MEKKIKVLNIKKLDGNFVEVEVKYLADGSVNKFIRKYYTTKDGLNGCIISGYEVKFNDEMLYIETTLIYETKGIKKSSTKNQSKGQQNNIVKEIKKETIKVKDGEIIKHEKYNEIKACLECNIPIYLAGPAGSGKNYTVEQIAKELNWNFYFSNSVQQEFKITGFIDAGGKFHDTEFYKACTDESDCVFFLDEMDASIPEVLVLLNAAIANGYFEFPTGRVDLKHVHFVSAGNTVGSGADELYTGRMVLDQATLDRFAIIEFDYDKNVELSIAKGNTDLVEFVRALRSESLSKGIRSTFSYRCIEMVVKLEGKIDLEKIIKIVIVKGLDKDTIKTLTPVGYNKYFSALKKVREAA